MAKFVTEKLTLGFSTLHKPDDKFGEDSANFNVSVDITPELQAQVKAAVQQTGAKKVNGVWENDEGVKRIKFKNRIMVKNGATKFPCVDSQNKPTDVTAASGDVVRLLLSPCLIKRDNSMSIYLDGVQIIEKNSTFGGGAGGGFDVVEGGYTADAAPAAPAADTAFDVAEEPDVPAADTGDDDLPF